MRIAPAALGFALVLGCRAEPTAPAAVVAHSDMSVDIRDNRGSRLKEDFDDFTVGAIDGQFDWKSIGGAGSASTATRCATYDHVIAYNKGSAYDGHGLHKRSLRISNAVTSSCYSDQTFSARVDDAAGQTGAASKSRDGTIDYALPGATLRNRLEAEWTFMSATPDAQQPGLEVIVSPARGDDHRMSWVRMADQADGIAVSFASRADPANPGAFQITTIATGLKRKKPHTIRLVMDFVDGPGNDIVKVFVDDDLRFTGGSWETYYALDANGAANFGGNPPAVNRLMFRTGSDTHRGVPGDPAPATLGKGFVFDDLKIVVSSRKDR